MLAGSVTTLVLLVSVMQSHHELIDQGPYHSSQMGQQPGYPEEVVESLESVHVSNHESEQSWRKVPGWVDGTTGVETKTDVDGGEAEADQEGDEGAGDLHVLVVRDGEDDDKKQGGAKHLVYGEGGGRDRFLGEAAGIGGEYSHGGVV